MHQLGDWYGRKKQWLFPVWGREKPNSWGTPRFWKLSNVPQLTEQEKWKSVTRDWQQNIRKTEISVICRCIWGLHNSISNLTVKYNHSDSLKTIIWNKNDSYAMSVWMGNIVIMSFYQVENTWTIPTILKVFHFWERPKEIFLNYTCKHTQVYIQLDINMRPGDFWKYPIYI